jgi:hypothetical protein
MAKENSELFKYLEGNLREQDCSLIGRHNQFLDGIVKMNRVTKKYPSDRFDTLFKNKMDSYDFAMGTMEAGIASFEMLFMTGLAKPGNFSKEQKETLKKIVSLMEEDKETTIIQFPKTDTEK